MGVRPQSATLGDSLLPLFSGVSKMRAYILLGMIGLSGVTFAVHADPAVPSQPYQAVNAPVNDPNRITCQTMGATSGSRIGGARE